MNRPNTATAVADSATVAAGRALSWVVERRALFAPVPDAAVPAQLVTLGELALLVHLVARDSPDDGAVDACLETLRAAYDEAAFRRALAEDRSAGLHAWLTVLLGLGERDAGAEARKIAERDPNAFAGERLPHRTLELCWLLEALGWSSPFAPEPAAVYRTTFLGRPHDTRTASPADAYAVTHAIAYLTDFGRKPFFADERAAAVADTQTLLRNALEWEHYDLVAEVLAALRWLRVPTDALQRTAWDRLAPQQLRSGAVVGIPADADLLASLQESDDAPFFRLLYHTTLVTVLASLSPQQREG